MRRSLRQLNRYLTHIPSIMAREAMIQATVASVPYMEEESRMEVLNEWSLVSGGKPVTNTTPISMEDFREDIQKRAI